MERLGIDNKKMVLVSKEVDAAHMLHQMWTCDPDIIDDLVIQCTILE